MSRSIASHRRALAVLLCRRRGPADDAVALPLARAAGRVLAADLVAPLDLPPHTNSQMDGFAVRVADLARARETGEAVTLPVRGTRAAGAVPAHHAPGTATAVMTGAVIPDGADAVLAVERVSPSRFDTPSITVDAELARTTPEGTFVRPVGSDVARGAVALPAGTLLGAAALGACAALGLTDTATVRVRRGPRVLVVTGGDEVIPAGTELRPGALYDANGPLLAAWLREAGAEHVIRMAVRDDPAAFVAALAAAVDAERPDLVITSGGISAGAFEVVRQGLEAHADDSWFGHVAMQPGGPQGTAVFHGVPVVCVPGNPVSTWVSCEVLVRPALAAAWGACAPPRWGTAVLDEPVVPLEARTQLRRGSITGYDDAGVPQVALVGGASSHLLTAAARADVLVQIPHGGPRLPSGATVAVLPVVGGVLPPLHRSDGAPTQRPPTAGTATDRAPSGDPVAVVPSTNGTRTLGTTALDAPPHNAPTDDAPGATA
ncbi:molybdopterin molybdenumtransferase MoeA [Kocuria varians]|uniref:Molybdopterin molybdenumtransferase n=1 Tax=Kocuria varians TaxID=1272 RepID=A0A4Y4CYL0_KOCVA|nr:gephyrin-like molybdotransferase Glp [Kocuria varians]GEC98025.1 molybdopterin molybdenumtransferase MoeA [Kocuria varians]